MRPTTLSGSAAFAVVASVLLTLATPLRAEDKPMDRLITVSASGYAYAEPDRAHINAGVTAEGKTATAALAANTELMTKVISGLKEAGIDAKDIQTSNFSVDPRYTNPQDNTPAVIDGYRVSNQLGIQVRDLKSLGGLLDKLVGLGANQINGLNFEVSQAETLKDDARKAAVANARRRAELLAAAAGAEIGEVVTISENAGYEEPRTMGMRAMKADAVPIEAGTETLQADVTVTWKLK